MKKKFAIPILLSLILMIIVGILVYYGHNSHNRNVISSLGYTSSFNDGWYITDNDTQQKINAQWLDYYLNENDTITVYHSIPHSATAQSNVLALRTAYIAFDVFINDNMCYSYGLHNSKFAMSKSPGWGWHFIEIPPESVGKTVRLDIKTFYHDGSESITDTYYGKSAVILRNIILKNMIGFSICVILLFTGIAFMLLHIIFNYVLKIKSHIFYMGVFLIIISIWSSCHTSIPMLFIEDIILINLVEYILILIIPLPLMRHIERTCTVRNTFLYNSGYIALIANFFIQFYLCSAGISDFHAMINISYLVILYCAAIMLYSLYDSRKMSIRENNENAYDSFIFYGFIIFLLGVGIDVAHVSIAAVSDASLYLRPTLLVFTIAVASKNLYELADYARQNYISESVRGLAYTDTLTGLGNRTSFTDTLRETELSKRKYETLAVYIFDVNYLKYVNDNFGHLHGDKLIIACAEAIKNTFTQDFRLFRIGGDEFAALYSGDLSHDVLTEYITTFTNDIATYNKEHRGPFELSVAVGVAFMNSSRTETMDELFKRADRIMYDNKKSMKKAAGHI